MSKNTNRIRIGRFEHNPDRTADRDAPLLWNGVPVGEVCAERGNCGSIIAPDWRILRYAAEIWDADFEIRWSTVVEVGPQGHAAAKRKVRQLATEFMQRYQGAAR